MVQLVGLAVVETGASNVWGKVRGDRGFTGGWQRRMGRQRAPEDVENVERPEGLGANVRTAQRKTSSSTADAKSRLGEAILDSDISVQAEDAKN